MNDTMIEAMSQFEIPRPILRSSVWPDSTGTWRAAVSYGCNVVREFQEHGPPLPVGTPSCQHFRPKPVIAVDLTAKPKEIREEGHVPQSVNGKEVHLGAASEPKPSKPVEPSKARFQLTRFRDIAITEGVAYLVKDLLPAMGLVVVWGPPKCGKSFWMFDLSMHIALGREYRGRRVQQGPVVYLALEGGKGFTHRVQAFRRRHSVTDAPFYLITDRTDLVADHKQLIAEITVQSSERPPPLL